MGNETREAAISVLNIVHKQLQNAIVSPPLVNDTSKQVDWAALVPVLQTSERLMMTFQDLIGTDKWAMKNAGPDVETVNRTVRYWMVLLRHTLVGQGKLHKVSDNPQA